MKSPAEKCILLGEFAVYPDSLVIKGKNQSWTLEPKCLQVLLRLAENSHQLVKRDTLLDELWPDTPSGDHALTRCISMLRRILDDNPDAPQYIETIPRLGYRLIADSMYKQSAVERRASAHISWIKRLRWLATAKSRYLVIGLVVVTTLLILSWGHSPTNTPNIIIHSGPDDAVFFLPLAHMENDIPNENILLATEDVIISALLELDLSLIIAGANALRPKQLPQNPQSIAYEIGVNQLIYGMFKTLENHVEVRLYIWDSQAEAIVWTKTFYGKPNNIAPLLTSIHDEIAMGLTPMSSAVLP